MGEVGGIVFNCSRFLGDTMALIDGKVTNENNATNSALLFPLMKLFTSAEILHLCNEGTNHTLALHKLIYINSSA